LTFFSILIIIWASARASKMMEAAQVGGIVVLPVLIIGLAPLLVGGLGNVYFALATIAVFAVLDWRLFKFSSKKFTREAILGKL
jgi:hypothetical protein